MNEKEKIMKHSYLIQRLQKPYIIPEENKDKPLAMLMDANPFAFGGGLKNGGLSKEANELLKVIFRFDYMGSSEFEWGAVPKALGKIVENIKNTITFQIEVHAQTWKKEKGTGIVYVICQKDWKDEIIKRIEFYAQENVTRSREYMTKESIHLNNSIIDKDDTHKSYGWLELDNGYMFFTDKEMFENTCKLFGINKK